MTEQDARSPAARRLRRIATIGSWVISQLDRGRLRPSAMEIPIATTREPLLAAWIESLSDPAPASPRDLTQRSQTGTVLIRPITVNDRALLLEGFDRLSPRSRQQRFLGVKVSLSPAELDHLTDVDHREREALVALSGSDGYGIGVARYTRDPSDPYTAEVAVTVIDEWHRQGVGRELTTRLIERARDEGIRRFTALIANDNLASIRLMRSLDLRVDVMERDFQTTEYEIALVDRCRRTSSGEPVRAELIPL